MTFRLPAPTPLCRFFSLSGALQQARGAPVAEDTLFEQAVHIDALRRAVERHGDAAPYHAAWRVFARTCLANTIRTTAPIAFPWQLPLLNGTSVEVSDPSTLFESACSTLALAAALQREGSVASLTQAALIERELVVELRHFAPRLAPSPPGGAMAPREPYVLSAEVHEAFAHALEAQSAMVQMHGQEAFVARAQLALRAAAAFRRAAVALPGIVALEQSRQHARATALYQVAQEVEQQRDTGVAIALLVRARALETEPTSAASVRLEELHKLNATVDFSELLSATAVTLRMDPAARELRVERGDATATVTLPVNIAAD